MYLSDIASEGYYSPSRSGTRNIAGSTRDVDSIAGGPRPRRSSHAPAPAPLLAPAYHHDSPPAPPTSIPLDDNFDAYTTEVPTEWGRVDEYDRDESVSGYRNYVTEMERMLAGQMDNAPRVKGHYHTEHQQLDTVQSQAQTHDSGPPGTLRRSNTSVSESVRGSRLGESRRGTGGRSFGSSQQPQQQQQHPSAQPHPLPMSPPENARQVSGKKGQIELVEQRILEDSPSRTISLWRERVAQSSAGGSGFGDDAMSEVDSHVHANPRPHERRRVSSETRLRRVASEQAKYAPSADANGTRNGSVRGTDNGKAGRASYERSEYMISYHQNTKSGLPKLFSPRTDTSTLHRDLNTPSSPTLSKMYERSPPSPTLRRHVPRKSLDRSEYMVTYPQTPPLTGSQASSGSPAPLPKGNGHCPEPRSPVHKQRPSSFREDTQTGSVLRATSTSPVEVILSSCDPSLLHIAPILYELGIKRVDHLRAIARLSEDTRDREVKAQALKSGVTVLEWAIFLDKLQSL